MSLLSFWVEGIRAGKVVLGRRNSISRGTVKAGLCGTGGGGVGVAPVVGRHGRWCCGGYAIPSRAADEQAEIQNLRLALRTSAGQASIIKHVMNVLPGIGMKRWAVHIGLPAISIMHDRSVGHARIPVATQRGQKPPGNGSAVRQRALGGAIAFPRRP